MASSWTVRLATSVALGALLAGTAVSGALAQSEHTSEATSHELEQRTERALDDGSFVSVSAHLRHGSRHTDASAGVGDLRSGEPVPRDAQFRIASTTKTFVATVLLQLAGEGKLSLDDSVERWLPGVVAGNGNDGTRVTLRNLLQNTSGLANYTNHLPLETAAEFDRYRFRQTSPEKLVKIAMEHEPSFPPADKGDPEPDWEYSNTNFVLAGMVIKAVTGHDWRTEVRQRLVQRLELTDTYAPGSDPHIRGPHARTYYGFPDRAGWTDTTVRNVSWGDAAGELVSSHRDLNRFFTALLGGELLRPTEQRQMQRTVPMSEEFQEVWPGSRYGLALMEQPLPCDATRWSHGGDIPGSSVRGGFTADGRVGMTAVTSGGDEKDETMFRAEEAMADLVEGAMCSARESRK